MLVVDMQQRLLAAIERAPQVIEQVGRLIDGAKVLGVPVVVTEQYPKGLGRTVEEIGRRLDPNVPIQEKLRFSACTEITKAQLLRLGARSVLVCGVEAHVCVLQTCLDLAEAGYVTAVAVDAIGSRRETDREAAISRMIQAEVIPTTVESALLELVGEAGSERFKALLPLIK